MQNEPQTDGARKWGLYGAVCVPLLGLVAFQLRVVVPVFGLPYILLYRFGFMPVGWILYRIGLKNPVLPAYLFAFFIELPGFCYLVGWTLYKYFVSVENDAAKIEATSSGAPLGEEVTIDEKTSLARSGEAHRWGVKGAVWFAGIFLFWTSLGLAIGTPIVAYMLYGAGFLPGLTLRAFGLFASGSYGDEQATFLICLLFVFFIEIPGLGYLAGRALYKFMSPA